jgi:hypothetical protein
MGRQHTFWDSIFENKYFDNDDKGSFIPNTVYVGIAFRHEMDFVYDNIKNEARKLGLKAKRVDRDEVGSGLINKYIAKGIEDAEFLIFNLTYERPSVYYELGYAHGIGNEASEILLTAKSGTEIHTDIKSLRIQYYE